MTGRDTGLALSVIGCGYLGAVHAVCLAAWGHEVVGVDVDERRVEALRAGTAPFHEPGLPEALAAALSTGRLTFTSDLGHIGAARAHFLTVGTPQRPESYAADLRQLWAAVDAVLEHAEDHPDGPVVVAGKSTVPVGTAEQVAARVARSPLDAVVAWNPEFLREGFAVQDSMAPDRLVYGLPDDAAAASVARDVLDAVYAPILRAGTPRILLNYPTAELVKVAANSFLATKISFINSMAQLCDATGADVDRLAEAIGYDERIGRKFLRAGIGFGGGCLPKDIRAFMARAGELGVDESLTFLREIDSINLRRRDHAVAVATSLLGGHVQDARVAVLGLAFKPDSDDVRDSPALDIAGRLAALGASVVATDPAATAAARAVRPQLSVVATAEEALEGADLVLLLTEWAQYVALDPAEAKRLVSRARIFDGRNVLDPAAWTSAGWEYRGVGRAAPAR